MKNVRLNERINLSIADYEETEQAEMTGRLLPDNDDRTEWYGYGTVGGLNARAVYMTTAEDMEGELDYIDWDVRLHHVSIMLDDGVNVVDIYNPDYSEA